MATASVLSGADGFERRIRRGIATGAALPADAGLRGGIDSMRDDDRCAGRPVLRVFSFCLVRRAEAAGKHHRGTGSKITTNHIFQPAIRAGEDFYRITLPRFRVPHEAQFNGMRVRVAKKGIVVLNLGSRLVLGGRLAGVGGLAGGMENPRKLCQDVCDFHFIGYFSGCAALCFFCLRFGRRRCAGQEDGWFCGSCRRCMFQTGGKRG